MDVKIKKMKENIKKIIACPNCKSQLILETKKLRCNKCKKEFEFQEETPVLL